MSEVKEVVIEDDVTVDEEEDIAVESPEEVTVESVSEDGIDSEEVFGQSNHVIETSPEQAAFYDYLFGKTDKPPAEINAMTHDIIQKLSLAVSVSTISSLKRLDNLNSFLSQCEQNLCDPETFEMMETKDKMNIYNSLKGTASSLTENSRRVIAQMKDSLIVESTASKMTSKLLALSDEDLGALGELIELSKGTASLKELVAKVKQDKEPQVEDLSEELEI